MDDKDGLQGQGIIGVSRHAAILAAPKPMKMGRALG
jgi:hypothetical protein